MNFKVGRPTTCRWVNALSILSLLREKGPLSRAAIARDLGLNPASVSRIVAELVDKGLIREHSLVPTANNRLGRPPVLLEFNFQAGVVAAVDLGGTVIQAALLDLFAAVLFQMAVPMHYGEDALQVLVNVLADLYSYDEIRKRPSAIVVGVPGIVVSDKGTVVSAPSLAWDNLPLKQILEERFSVPVVVENDVNLRAIGEHWKGAGQGMRHFVYVLVEKGVGAGIILNGDIYRGATWSAGEIGYFVPCEDFLGLEFRELGCLEKLLLAPDGTTVGDSSSFGYIKDKTLVKNARTDEANNFGITPYIAHSKAKRKVHYLIALALINIMCTINPELIVLGGKTIENCDLDFGLLNDLVTKACPFAARIVPSALKDKAGIVGGVALALRSEQFLEVLLQRGKGG